MRLLHRTQWYPVCALATNALIRYARQYDNVANELTTDGYYRCIKEIG